MVKVIETQKRTSDDGKKEFNVLVLQGGIETRKSQTSGKFYITAKRANMICTFSEAEAKLLVGTELPGTIEKELCSPYQYRIPGSDEMVELNYTYCYKPEQAQMEEAVFQNAG